MLGRLARALLCLSLVSCAPSEARDTSCGTATLGPSGGALIAGNGATLVVPPGALTTATEVSICALTGFAPRRDQLSDLIVVRPTSLALAMPASFTIPIDAESITEGGRIEIGQSVEDTAPTVLTVLRSSRASASFDHDHFGYLRVFGMGPVPVDAGTDAMRDAARGDSGPTPIAPVVVGIDLDPANYACLGARTIPTRGADVPVELHVVDWHDRSFRAGYMLRLTVAPPSPDFEFDCSTTPDCVAATSDADGNASVTVPSGPLWFDVVQLDPMTPFVDDRHAPVRQVHLPIEIPEAGGPVVLEAVSQRSHTAVGGFSFHFGQLGMGHVRDCDGAAVQRARIRLFDEVARTEILDPGGSGMFTYGSTGGLPTGGRDRTGADGTFLIDNFTGVQTVRIEAWGQLVEDGPEVMLSCELREVTSNVIVVGDLLPFAANRPVSCSE